MRFPCKISGTYLSPYLFRVNKTSERGMTLGFNSMILMLKFNFGHPMENVSLPPPLCNFKIACIVENYEVHEVNF